MIDTTADLHRVKQARARALIVPREHGAWGLLLIPLFTGAVVGGVSSHQIWPLVLFATAALALFWLRTPIESLLGTSPLSAESPMERRTALAAAITLAGVSVSCLAGLMYNGHNRGLLLLGGISALAFIAQGLLKKLGRAMRMSAQLVGALGLTCTAAAAYYVATGRLDERAVGLWAANWIFAGNQIHFVQLRIHAARAASFREKFARGPVFFLAQLLLLPILAAASRLRLVPALVIIAFLPALVRGIYWFFRGPQPLHIKSLGWSEMKQGILFGVLLVAVFLIS
jgi:hypothetical protein